MIVGALTFCLIIGAVALIADGKDIPDWFSALIGSGMGALATLLVSRQNIPPSGE